MSTNYLTNSLLALIAALAISSSSSLAQPVRDPLFPQSGDDINPSLLFQNLVTDETALAAWNKIDGKQADVNCDALPLGEFARQTCKLFNSQFDIIWPGDDRDANSLTLKMRLKDVRAIEIFNAMNLYFEAQTVPARWKLALNGNRPTAILTMKKSQVASTPPVGPERKTTVFDISGPLYASGPGNYKQSAANLTETLEAVLDDISDKPVGYGEIRKGAPVIKIHAEAAILVFTGTAEETELIRSTLGALNDGLLRKAEVLEREQREQKASIDGNPK